MIDSTIIDDCYAKLRDLISKAGYSRLQERLNATGRLRQSDKLTVMVVGEFNVGKTTLVNSLLNEEDFLPTDIVKRTSTINVIDSSYDQHTVVYQDGDSKPINGDLSSFFEELTDDEADQIRYVRIQAKSELLGPDIRLVDTPGVNDISDHREAVTYGFLHFADAVVFMTGANQPFSQTEREFLEKNILSQELDNIFFVVSKIDQLDADERTNLESLQNDGSLRELIGDTSLHLVSALEEDDGFETFKTKLKNYLLDTDHQEAIHQSRFQSLHEIVAAFENRILEERNQLQMNNEDRKKRQQELQSEIKQAEKSLENLKERLRRENKRLKKLLGRQFKNEISTQKKAFRQIIDGHSSKSIDDLKTKVSMELEELVENWVSSRRDTIRQYLQEIRQEVQTIFADQFMGVLTKPSIEFDNSPESGIEEISPDAEVSSIFSRSEVTWGSFLSGAGLGAILGPSFAVAGAGIAGYLSDQLFSRYKNSQIEEIKTDLDDLIEDLFGRFYDLYAKFFDHYFEQLCETLDETSKNELDLVRENITDRMDQISSSREELESRLDTLSAIQSDLQKIKREIKNKRDGSNHA